MSVHICHLLVLSLIKLSLLQREKIHRCLMNMHNLRIMELDLTKWDPQPTGALQKILTTELRIFCPSVEFIAFWVGGLASSGHWTEIIGHTITKRDKIFGLSRYGRMCKNHACLASFWHGFIAIKVPSFHVGVCLCVLTGIFIDCIWVNVL